LRWRYHARPEILKFSPNFSPNLSPNFSQRLAAFFKIYRDGHLSIKPVRCKTSGLQIKLRLEDLSSSHPLRRHRRVDWVLGMLISCRVAGLLMESLRPEVVSRSAQRLGARRGRQTANL
jgi:hypothetical protein